MRLILDVDGTLVDSNFHHALAWQRALSGEGVEIALWRIHRAIGMGGDRILSQLAGDEFERTAGAATRARHDEVFSGMIESIAPLPGARDAVMHAAAAFGPPVLASSARSEETEHYLDLLDLRSLVGAWTTAADVDRTKPAPDLVEIARDRCGGGPVVMIGDTPWDAAAARATGVPCHGVLTGGRSVIDLKAAGCVAVHEDIGAAVAHLAASRQP